MRKKCSKERFKWGTGGINIDWCRVGTEEIIVNRHEGQSNSLVESTKGKRKWKQELVQWRFPANFIWSCNEDEYKYNGLESDLLEIQQILWE